MRQRPRNVQAQAHHLNTGRSTRRAWRDHSSITAPMVMEAWTTACVGKLYMRLGNRPLHSLPEAGCPCSIDVMRPQRTQEAPTMHRTLHAGEVPDRILDHQTNG